MKDRSVIAFMFAWVMGLILVSVSSAGAAAPSPLPKPTGNYAVGRTSFEWTDTSRPDPDSPSGRRQLVVWLWYPASAKAGAQPARWAPGKWADGLWTQMKQIVPVLAEQKNNPLPEIRAHAYADAPVLAGKTKHPILLFMPGAGQGPLIYSALLEDLASHGYVVAAVVPTYYSGFTVFSGGRMVTKDKGQPPLPTRNSEKRTSDKQQAIPLPDGRTVYATPEEIALDMKEMNEFPHTFLSVWTGDMAFTLSRLQKLDADDSSPFNGRLDLTKVGAFGHSYGGAASMQIAKDDARVLAAVDIDGNAWGDVAKKGELYKPVMLLGQLMPEEQIIADAAHLNAVYRSGKPAYRLSLVGAQHYFSADFGVFPFIPQEVKTAGIGTIDPVRALIITRDYLRAFFDQYLLARKSPLLQAASSQYPEIQFEVNTQPKRALTRAPSTTPAPSAAAATGGVTGTWVGVLSESGLPKQTLRFDIRQEGNSITGGVTGAPPRPDARNALSSGKIEGDRISFVINAKDPGGNAASLKFDGKLADERIQGTLKTPLGRSPLTLARE